MKEKRCRQIWFPLWAMEIRLFRGLSECPANRNIIFRLYRFSFHKPIKSRLVRGRLYLPNLRYELHHRICKLRYGTHGYGRSAYIGFCRSQHGLTVFRTLDWRIFIDTVPRLLYTKPTSKSQTNNSYDYEEFILVIILTTFLSADPKPNI